MNRSYDFTGQVALVTGASSGIGSATAQVFAEAGAAVTPADVNADAVRAAADKLSAAGHQVLGISCDVSSEDQVAATIDQTVATFGRLDMAFNNAGIEVPFSDAADDLAEYFDRVNAVNYRGVWASDMWFGKGIRSRRTRRVANDGERVATEPPRILRARALPVQDLRKSIGCWVAVPAFGFLN
jgi:NAD(P)-dependent dehydrogenase (short-subunit alcohol dehydrogenase family)